MKITVINGPNLQLLGVREKGIYGTATLPEICNRVQHVADELGVQVDFFQSNSEGALLDRIAATLGDADGIVINPGAYTHTSLALRDALAGVALPAVEVHLSNVHQREEIRRRSLTADACVGVFAGFGGATYEWALRALCEYIHRSVPRKKEIDKNEN